MKQHPAGKFILLMCITLMVFLFSLSVGSASITVGKTARILLGQLPFGHRIYTGDVTTMQKYIILQVRLPRILVSGLVGAALSIVGGVFQGIFDNPIADPHIMGVSSGAAFGATIAIVGGLSFSAVGMGAISLCAFAGALVTLFFVVLISGVGKSSTVTVLLVGTAFSTLFSALISLMMAFHREDMEKVYMWTFGSFSAANWAKIGWMAALAALGLIVLLLLARDLNLLSMGEETAASVGVETGRVRVIVLIVCAMMTGMAVSVSGMIGFVGLVVPHCMRFIFGDDYHKLLPACLFGGAAFMMLSDTVARVLIAPGELPVGVITALIGAPYFIWMIHRHAR